MTTLMDATADTIVMTTTTAMTATPSHRHRYQAHGLGGGMSFDSIEGGGMSFDSIEGVDKRDAVLLERG